MTVGVRHLQYRIEDVYRAVQIRQVRRNGKTNDAQPIRVSKDDISDLIASVEGLLEHIDPRLPSEHRQHGHTVP